MNSAISLPSANLRRRAWIALTPLLSALSAGCQSPPPPPKFTFINGEVTACRPETGEVTVDIRAGRAGQAGGVVAHFSEHSELYIDDRLAPLAELRPGDAVELLVYRDQDAYVVTTARVTRTAAPPPVPEMLRGIDGAPGKEN